MKTKRRTKSLSVAVIFLAIILLVGGIYIYLTRLAWGYARSVPEYEGQWRDLLVATAESWLGANEADGGHRPIIDVYNDHPPLARGYKVRYDDEWCSTFVSAVSIQCGLTEIIPTECGCEPHINLFQSISAWQEEDYYIPLPGDIIFYHWNTNCAGDCMKRADHVGIVVGTFGDWIKVIEGNKNEDVSYRYLQVNDANIRGYGTPHYSGYGERYGSPQGDTASLRNTTAGQAILEYAHANGYDYGDYPESLIYLLLRNPETEKFVLEYPMMKGSASDPDMTEYDRDEIPLFLQWDQDWGYLPYSGDLVGITGCGPVCLSMAAWYLTGDPEMTPNNMVQFAIENRYYVKGSGSSWELISEGGKKLGFDVTEIPLDKGRIFRNLEVDNPIICAMGPGDFTSTGHFIVLAGCEDGLIKINDPNSLENSQRLWSYEEIEDQIRNIWVIRN